MAYNLDSLIADLKRGSYTPKTEAELQNTASNRYQSYYDQQRLGANQAAETTGLALNRQLGELRAAYDKQRQNASQQYQQAYSNLDRQMLGRGMQRSSYGMATLGNVAIAGNRALQEITDNEQRAVGNVQDQQTLLARQLADQLRQYSASQAADTLAYLDELESREYDRGVASDDRSNSLAMQIYQFANQKEQQDAASQQWAKQFDESIRQYNTSLAEQQRQANLSQQNWQKSFESNETQRQFENLLASKNFDENIRQFNASLDAQQKQASQSQENWVKEFAESVRQSDRNFAEQVRQFGESMSAEEKKMAMSADQFLKNFTEQQRQFDLSYALDKMQADKLYGSKKTSTNKNPPPPPPPLSPPPADDPLLTQIENIKKIIGAGKMQKTTVKPTDVAKTIKSGGSNVRQLLK